jgi:putative ABC transport system permease protein
VVAVTALTAVGFFTDRVGRGVNRQAAAVLAADLSLRSAHPVDADVRALAGAYGVDTVSTVSFPTVITGTSRGGERRRELVSLKAAEPGYPLRGEVRVADAVGDAGTVADGVPPSGEVWADTNLVLRLGGRPGGTVKIGEATFTISKVLVSRPDQAIAFSDVAPGLLMRLEDLERTGLLVPGSRVTWRQLFAGDEPAMAAFRPALEARVGASASLSDPRSAQGPMRAALLDLQRFLGLAAMSAVILAGAAVAIAASRFMRRHLDTAALIKVIGRPQREVTLLFALELLAIAVAGGAAGIVLGYGVQAGLARLAATLIDVALPPPSALPVLGGVATALLVVGGFALPQLDVLRRASPMRVLRDDLPAPGARALLTTGGALLALALLLWLVVRDLALVAWTLGGLVASTVVLLALAWLAVRAVGRSRGASVGVSWRYGLASIARRGWDSASQIVAFGLGLAVMLLLALLRGDLLEAWQQSLPEDAPNYFLLNIQPHEREPLRELFAEYGLEANAFAPASRGRLTAIDGTPVEEITFPRDDGGVVVQSEANITWSETLPAANRIVRGKWWNDPAVAELSVEEETFETLGLSLGDVMAFDVAGERFEATVTSVREVDWDSFEPNFFLVFSPGVFGDLPTSWLTSVHVPDDARDGLLALGDRFPTVTVFDVNALLNQVRSTVSRAVAAIQYVFALTLVAAVLVLLAAVEATREPRMLEAATLRALGASRRQVLAGIATEYGLIGALAGLGAAAGAGALGVLLGRNAFGFDYWPSPTLALTGLIAGVVLVGGAGLAAAGRSAGVPPVRVLNDH